MKLSKLKEDKVELTGQKCQVEGCVRDAEYMDIRNGVVLWSCAQCIKEAPQQTTIPDAIKEEPPCESSSTQ